MASAGLSTEEVALVARFMKSAAADFSYHSANDFLLPATDENKAIFTAVLEHHNKSGDRDHEITAEKINMATDEVFIYDDWAMEYFAERCENLAKDPGIASLSQAELFALGDLLSYAYEDHERTSDDIDHDMSLPASGGRRAILAETIKLHRTEHAGYPGAHREKVAAKLASIAPAFLRGGEVTIPDFWIMYCLAHKCRTLSGSDKPLYDPADTAKGEANETEWSKDYVPTAADLRSEDLRKEVRDLARTRFKAARAETNLTVDRYLSVLILADTDAERDALHDDKAFVAALGLVRKKAKLRGFEFQCFAFLSQEAIDRGDDWVAWWFEGVCPQIRYGDDEGLSARDKALRLGYSPEILDLMTKTESVGSAAPEDRAAPDAGEAEGKGVAAFLCKHWLVVGFFAFFLAVLIFGKSAGK
ncbi:MAG: hypothetical protein ACXWF6_08040 [Usitatibacter sp.]